MDKIINRLESKWGLFVRDKYFLKQCDLSNDRNKNYLNVLFNPVSNNEYELAKELLKCEFHPSLNDFYKKYNGLMLFSESLRIYGIELGHNEIYDSYDIVSQNINDDIKSYNKDFTNFIVFGYYSSWLFCFDMTDLKFLYVVDTTKGEIVYKFNSIEELLTHYIDYLINEYDINGKKIHYDKKLEGLPIANVSLEFI